jgi:HPt (histidine-containing phosphotransfer) domain-containing protein
MDEFVTKPISPALLFEVIARRLRRGSGGERRAAGRPGQGAAQAGREDPELIDMAALALTFGGDPDKMRKYALLFIDSARDGLAEMATALERSELTRLADLGHRTKSSARAVGAMGFAELCLALERFRERGTLEEARAIVNRMVELHERLRHHIATDLVMTASR